MTFIFSTIYIQRRRDKIHGNLHLLAISNLFHNLTYKSPKEYLYAYPSTYTYTYVCLCVLFLTHKYAHTHIYMCIIFAPIHTYIIYVYTYPLERAQVKSFQTSLPGELLYPIQDIMLKTRQGFSILIIIKWRLSCVGNNFLIKIVTKLQVAT